jgi:uncharacterized protein
MKQGIRALGIDDSPFAKNSGPATVIGVVCRMGKGTVVEGVLSTSVLVDGDDSTSALCSLILGSRFYRGLHVILLNSIMLGGFNAVDIRELSRATKLPVIAITRKKPNKPAAEKAVRNTPNWEAKLARMREAGEAKRSGAFYIQFSGTDLKQASDILAIFGNEPVRLAHIIASGVARGESHGRA